MIEMTAEEYFKELHDLLNTKELTLFARYRQMRFLFERLCRDVTEGVKSQFPNLFSRLSWILQHRLKDDPKLSNELNALRVHLNQIAFHHIEPDQDAFSGDLLILAQAIAKFKKTILPDEFYKLEKSLSKKQFNNSQVSDHISRLRVRFVSRENDDLYVIAENQVDNTPIRVHINLDTSGTQVFAQTLEDIHPGAQLNLLQVKEYKEESFLTAEMVVLEPDFLMDISSIAECFKDYGHHPLNYFMTRLSLNETTQYMLLGNIANQFLDDIVNETETEKADYLSSMKKAFRFAPLALATCPDLDNDLIQKDFFVETQKQFLNIQDTVHKLFLNEDIKSSQALLEPSFICESLGIQGRLDFLQDDYKKFIELKSGKGNLLYPSGKVTHKESHYVQMMLYYAVLQFNLGVSPNEIDAYLLYSKYPYLYHMAPYWGLVKQAIDLRNQIVALEYRIQQHNDPSYTREILQTINANTLNTKNLNNKFWSQYLRPSIDAFSYEMNAMSEIESDYFNTLYTFITKEQYTIKAGDSQTEYNKGVSSLWSATPEEKKEAGEIICDMTLTDSQIEEENHILTFSLPLLDELTIPNYRVGDAVVLYQRNQISDTITNKQVFKASIDFIDSHLLKLRLRAIQKNKSVLPKASKWAIERDFMDAGFVAMYKGLAQFLVAPTTRKMLLLAQRIPQADSFVEESDYQNDVDRIVAKAVAAKDYFLLVGPPGTGKTSCALRQMVSTFYGMPNQNILLLAYTNKAVDEICHSIASIEPEIPFVRIGQESACDSTFKEKLLPNVIASCSSRKQVRDLLNSYRVFVGTVSSVSKQNDLFRLKRFDVAIIDEATQILEPQLLGILCAVGPDMREAVRKFILIGDYKQLPAVVVQSDDSSVVQQKSLQNIGMQNLKESLFERLYRNEVKQNRHQFCDMLTKQGRMHPLISAFSKQYFYQDLLDIVPLPHQLEAWTPDLVNDHDFRSMIFEHRFAFFPVENSNTLSSNKVSQEEASLIAKIIKLWFAHEREKNASVRLLDEVGVITPYRSQIAMIRKELQRQELPDADQIVIDTVERFQGGQRNLMLYSCCMNRPYQLNFLSNTIEEAGALIDRKLNVALTRARKQMFVVGNPHVLRRDVIYHKLLDHFTHSKGYYKGDYHELKDEI